MRSDPFESYANFTNCLTSGLKNGMGVCEIISACGDFFIDVLKDLLVALGDFIAVCYV